MCYLTYQDISFIYADRSFLLPVICIHGFALGATDITNQNKDPRLLSSFDQSHYLLHIPPRNISSSLIHHLYKSYLITELMKELLIGRESERGREAMGIMKDIEQRITET